MFDERRQRSTGIDKSYPLQPITTKTSPINQIIKVSFYFDTNNLF